MKIKPAGAPSTHAARADESKKKHRHGGEHHHGEHTRPLGLEAPVVSTPRLSGDSRSNTPVAVGSSDPLPFVVEGRQLPLPQVAALLQKYGGPKGEVHRPYERILNVLASIEAQISQQTDPEKLVDAMLTNDLRRQVFLLEGQMRLYEDRLGKPGKHLAKKAAELEDALGNTLLDQGLVKTAQDKGASPKVVQYLQGQLETTRNGLNELVAKDWHCDPTRQNKVDGVADFLKVLNDVDWPKYDDDRADLMGEIAKHVEVTEEKSYDMNDMPEGIHALRRALRWTHLSYEATGGLMQLDDQKNPVPEFKALLTAPIASSKFVTLPEATREKNPVVLSKSVYLANLDWMLKLGALKDRGEPVDHLAEAMVAVGEASSEGQARAKASALLGPGTSDAEIHAEARTIYEQIKDSGLFEAQLAELAAVH